MPPWSAATVTIHVINVLGEYMTPQNQERDLSTGTGPVTLGSDADEDELTVTAIDGNDGAIDTEITTDNGGRAIGCDTLVAFMRSIVRPNSDKIETNI